MECLDFKDYSRNLKSRNNYICSINKTKKKYSMKKNLLFIASLLLGSQSFGQFTQANEPTIGQGTTLYVIDSAAVNYEAVTGAGVEWDYSMYAGYGGDFRNISVADPVDTGFESDFTGATTALAIQDFLINFSSSTATERISQGFVYSEVNLGDVMVKFNIDDAIQYEYTFDLGDVITDNFIGEMTNANLGTHPLTGQLTATVDGFGTLKLADGVTLTDVSRYRISDVSTIIVSGTGLFDGTYELVRDQFEYYDLNNSSLPAFVYTTVILRLQGSSNPLSEFNLALSEVDPTAIVNLEDLNVGDFSIYPNPAADLVQVSFKNEITNASVSIIDAAGRLVLTQELNAKYNTIDVSALDQGIYFVNIINAGTLKSEKIVIK
jgi:hypothetical protein